MNTQTISKKDLLIIYNSGICEGWQKKIVEVLFKEHTDSSKISVENSLVEKAYSEANDAQKKMLKKYFKIFLEEDILDEIGDFKDILKLSGKTLSEILPFKETKILSKAQKSQNALAKIQLITEVYNQGWIPDFLNTNESKHYPYFQKKARGGWVLSHVCYDRYGAGGVGFGSYFKTEKLARDAANKFMSIYIDYLPL